MSFLRRMNFQRKMHTLRSIDYENMDASAAKEGRAESGRLSDSLYEGTSRVPLPEGGLPDDEAATIDHLPVQGERPHPRAQWDDLNGRWIIWSDEAGDWVPVESDAAS